MRGIEFPELPAGYRWDIYDPTKDDIKRSSGREYRIKEAVYMRILDPHDNVIARFHCDPTFPYATNDQINFHASFTQRYAAQEVPS